MSLSLDDIVEQTYSHDGRYGGGNQVTPTQIYTSRPLAEVYINPTRMSSFLTFAPSQGNHFPQDDHQLILEEIDFFFICRRVGLPLK